MTRTLKAVNRILWEEEGGNLSLHRLIRDHLPEEESFELRPEETSQENSGEIHSSGREHHVQMS